MENKFIFKKKLVYTIEAEYRYEGEIRRILKKHPEIFKSYIKENGGQGSARNYGVKMAKRRIYRICRFR